MADALDRIKIYLEDAMSANGSENSVKPYISFNGNYSSLNWHEFKARLLQEGQTASTVVNNFNGDMNMRDKIVNKNNSFVGEVQQGGERNNQTINNYPPICSDSKEMLNAIVKSCLTDKAFLNSHEREAIEELKSAVEEDDQRKLPVFWNAVNEATGFIANIATASQIILDHRVPILAALVAASAKISS